MSDIDLPFLIKRYNMNSTKYLSSSDNLKENNKRDINNLYFMMTFTNTDKVIKNGNLNSKNILKNSSSKIFKKK